MPLSLPLSLYVKSLLVGTPLEEVLKQLRWLLGAGDRRRHPELRELHLEERRLPDVLKKLLVTDSCGVDVGSHLGSFLSLLSKYAPDGHHVAFEPSVEKSQWLKRRFPGTAIHNCAVANGAGSAIFEENLTRPGFSSLKLRRDPSEAAKLTRYTVQICRLDDVLLDQPRIDLIKLDIEGGELDALRGASRVIGRCHPALIFECGTEYPTNEQGVYRRELYDFVTSDLKYDIFCFGDFLFDKGRLTFDEFRKCGLYPFRAFNFIALPHDRRTDLVARNQRPSL